MTHTLERTDFHPLAPDAAGIVTWVHIGDLHMDNATMQNYADLRGIVAKIDEQYAKGVSFVFLPGDNADHGAAAEYQLVRGALDRLSVPWCALVGDHDVHEKSFDHFQRYMSPLTHYRFQVGGVTFFALNAFGLPDPGSFALLSDQLEWLEDSLDTLGDSARVVFFLHCYPSELKQGQGELRRLVDRPAVMLVEMGHTHYNEVSNDGKTVYAATRSTGQIEEGPVGFSVTNVDGKVVSWKFAALTDNALLMITSPADERFLTERSDPAADRSKLVVRAKSWSKLPLRDVAASIAGHTLQLSAVQGSQAWQATLDHSLADGIYELTVTGTTADNEHVRDTIRVRIGDAPLTVTRAERDLENALESWPEHGLLGTQLGPNKNGKKW